jgi:hypothetical protein
VTAPNPGRLATDWLIGAAAALTTYLAFSWTAGDPQKARAVAQLETEVARAAINRPIQGSAADQSAARLLCRASLSRRMSDLEQRSAEWPARLGLRKATVSFGSAQVSGELAFVPVTITFLGEQDAIANALAQADAMPSVFFDEVKLISTAGQGSVLAEVHGRLACAAP